MLRRQKERFDAEDPPSASLQIFRSLPPAHGLATYLELADLHRLALVSRSWYGWVFCVELKAAWQRIITTQEPTTSGDRVEWKWEWSDWDPEASSTVKLEVRHHHVFTSFGNTRSSEQSGSKLLIKGEEGVPEMWCPALWELFERNPKGVEQLSSSQFLRESQNGADLVSKWLRSTVPEWHRIFCMFTGVCCSWHLPPQIGGERYLL